MAPDVQEQREHDREQDALFDADHDDHGCGHRGDCELVSAQTPHLAHACHVDELDADQEHDRRQDGVRHVLQRPGEEEQDERDARRRRELGDLAVALGFVHHLRLRGAAVDDEGAAQPGRDVGHRQPDEVRVLDESLAVLDRIGARRGGALRQDDEQHRRGDRQQPSRLLPPDPVREADMGQAARHRPQRGDAVRLQVEGPAHGDRPDHGDEAARDRLDPPLEDDQRREHRDGDRQGRPGRLIDLFQGVPGLGQRSAELVDVDGGRWDAQHSRELPERDLDADARQEPDEHRPRDEVGEEAEPRNARHEQEDGGDEGAQAGVGEPLGRPGSEAGDPERGDPREHDRGRGRVAAHDEMARRSEDCEGQDRKQDRVETGDDRRPGDPRVAHHLRDRQGRERDSGDDVAREPGPVQREDPLEQRHRAAHTRDRALHDRSEADLGADAPRPFGVVEEGVVGRVPVGVRLGERRDRAIEDVGRAKI